MKSAAVAGSNGNGSKGEEALFKRMPGLRGNGWRFKALFMWNGYPPCWRFAHDDPTNDHI